MREVRVGSCSIGVPKQAMTLAAPSRSRGQASAPDPGSGTPGPGVAEGRTRWLAIVTLLLLAAALSEILTGSTKVPGLVATPPYFAVLVGLYGAGALVIREVIILWKKRWASILLLGGAYALVEEGFALKTMIDPTGSIIGTSALYSYGWGINWVPFAALSLIEGTFSIAFMILLVELLFPQTRGKRLTGNVGLGIAMIIFGLTASLISHSDPYVPSIPVLLFLSGLGVAEIVAAHWIPADLLSSRVTFPDRSERSFFVAGMGFTGGILAIFLIGSHLPAVIDVILLGLVAVLPLLHLIRHAGTQRTEAVKIAFGLGLVAAFVPWDIALEISGDVGVLAFTAFALGLLIHLRARWRTPPPPG